MFPRLPVFASLGLALVAVALLVSACGGTGAKNGVATVPNVTTTTPPAVGGSGGGAPSNAPTTFGGSGSGTVFRLKTETGGAKFSACMRRNGVSNFPDPNSNGVITMDASKGLTPASPKFRTAAVACQKDLPNGRPSPQQTASGERRILAWARCMRKNGVPNFPDPTFSGNGNFTVGGSAINPNDPGFQKAMQACRSLAPLGGAGG